MKKLLFILIIMLIMPACSFARNNPNIYNAGFKDANIDRITITNNKYTGKYTLIDKKTIERFTSFVVKSKDATTDSNLEPDFMIDLYDGTRRVSTFKYTAGLNNNSIGNLKAADGKLYHVSTSIEDFFIKRLINKSSDNHVPEYYVSLITIVLNKCSVPYNSVVVVDISKDKVVTKSITSIEQKSILDSINIKNIKIQYPSTTQIYDYYIKIDTKKFIDNTCRTIVSVEDKNKVKTKFIFEGSYKESGWEYFIDFM